VIGLRIRLGLGGLSIGGSGLGLELVQVSVGELADTLARRRGLFRNNKPFRVVRQNLLLGIIEKERP